jgi:hypothetical protein
MRKMIDIDWSVIKDRLEYITNQHDRIDSPNYVERMQYLKTLKNRLMKGERSDDLYETIINLEC